MALPAGFPGRPGVDSGHWNDLPTRIPLIPDREGRYSDARRELHKLHFDGTNGDWIEAEYNEIRQTIEAGSL